MIIVDAPGDPTLDLLFAHGGPAGSAQIRSQPEDFQVTEELGYQPDGNGEHVFLLIRKRNQNTHDLARRISHLAGVRQVAIGYAGLKDRVAVTTQAFTVQLPGREAPDWGQLEDDDTRVLLAARHSRKIRRGSLRGNHFMIHLRHLQADKALLEQRLMLIKELGVPNYFGPQRFGRNGSNLQRAAALFEGRLRKVRREQRGMLLSAVRAWLFNQVLAERVKAGSWNQALPGDVMVLHGSERQFLGGDSDSQLAIRMADFDIHATGPLCGRKSRALEPETDVAELEQHVLADKQFWLEGLQRFGLDADRRALRLQVKDFDWGFEGDSLELSFSLGSGSYATTVIRELLVVTSPLAG